jgi:HPt (histidine-containing phosphotransfer) domain-containing protein
MLENTIDSPKVAPQTQKHAQKALFDAEAALDRLDGDEELFAMLITVFQQDSVQLFDQLTSNLAKGSLREAERAAHSLKGLAANFDADKATEVAFAIEQLARAGISDGLDRRSQELNAQLEKLRTALAEWTPQRDL